MKYFIIKLIYNKIILMYAKETCYQDTPVSWIVIMTLVKVLLLE